MTDTDEPLESLLLAYHNKTRSKAEVLELMHSQHFLCSDVRTMTAVNRLTQFYRAEQQMRKFDSNRDAAIFEGLMDDLFAAQKMAMVLPITVLCREPDGEMGELFLHEVEPKSLKKDSEWDEAVAAFVWQVIAKQSYELFFLSHSPQSRLPPAPKNVLSMTPAQIEAKQRAARFLLNSAFANKPDRMAVLHKQIGTSPWKYITTQLQTFGFSQGTVGYIRVYLDLSAPGKPAKPAITRGIVAMCDIKHPAMARAALFFDPYHEFLLVLETNKTVRRKPLLTVFVVAKALLSISEDGDVYQNRTPVKQ